MKLGLTTVSIAVAGINSYKVTIVANNLSEPFADAFVRTFLLDYIGGETPADLAVKELLQMMVEELSR